MTIGGKRRKETSFPVGLFDTVSIKELDKSFRVVMDNNGKLTAVDIAKEDVLRVLENVHVFEINKHYITGESIPTITEHVFGFEIKQDAKIRIDKNIYPEHDAIQWVSYKQALELLKWENNKTSLTKLQALLTQAF